MRMTASLHKMGDCLTSSNSGCKLAETANEASGMAACTQGAGKIANMSQVHKSATILFTMQKYHNSASTVMAGKIYPCLRLLRLSLQHDNQSTHHHRHSAVSMRLVVPHAVSEHSNRSRMALVGKQCIGIVLHPFARHVWQLCAQRTQAQKVARKAQRFLVCVRLRLASPYMAALLS